MNQTLSTPVEAYVETINTGDLAGLLALFAEDAQVKDAGREHHGTDAIRHWAEREIFAVDVTLEVVGRRAHDGEEVITTKVDGTFDRTGLPDPLLIDQHFRTAGGKITRLECKLVE